VISKNLYINILIRVALIVALSIALGWQIATGGSFRLSFILMLVLAILTVNLFYFLNSTNKKIKYFFDSVRNDDSSLSFPEEEKNRTVREIYKNMNRINLQIQQLKIENRNQEQYFRALIEHLAIGIVTYNSKGFVLHSNNSAKRLLGLDILTHTEQIGRADRKLYQAVKDIKPFERRLVRLATELGEIQLSLKAASFRMNGAELIILSIHDIKNELDEKEVDAWLKLIRILMHEIMNSITPITSLSESLSNIYNDGGVPVTPEAVTAQSISTTLRGLSVIKEQGRGLLSFVDSYRKLTRIPEPDRQIFRAAELLDRVRVLYNSLDNSNNTELEVSIQDPDLEIYADKNLISQVLINLVRNALESNTGNPAGKIKIIGGKDLNNRPEICVIDNGPGIAEEHLDEIFVPFFTTRQNGSGIGLSVSRQIMRVHGGNLKVRSVPGKETSFCLTF